MERQKRPILDTAKGKLQIEAEGNQKKPQRESCGEREENSTHSRKQQGPADVVTALALA